jgi:hypothetical protein
VCMLIFISGEMGGVHQVRQINLSSGCLET